MSFPALVESAYRWNRWSNVLSSAMVSHPDQCRAKERRNTVPPTNAPEIHFFCWVATCISLLHRGLREPVQDQFPERRKNLRIRVVSDFPSSAAGLILAARSAASRVVANSDCRAVRIV